MKLGELLQIRQTFDKTIEQKTLEMDTWFQNYLWDGYSDQNDPRFISPEDFEAIEALSDKIKHMTLNIGSPCSVAPMLESIIQRKIKRWSAYTYFYGNDPIQKGKQLRTKDDRNMVKKAVEYERQGTGINTGHFRWNDRGYLLSRRATDLLEEWYSQNF